MNTNKKYEIGGMILSSINFSAIFYPIVIFLAVRLFFYNNLKKIKGKILIKFVFFLLLFIYLLGVFIARESYMSVDFKINGGYEALGPLIGLIFVIFISSRIGSFEIKLKESNNFFNYIIIIFMLDIILRIINLKDYSVDGLMGDFKYGGIFPTSNVAGYTACMLCAICINLKFYKKSCIFLIIVILSFSRTSIIALPLIVFLAADVSKILKSITILLGASISIGIFNWLNINWSFESKILMIMSYIDFIDKADFMTFIFGVEGGRTEIWKILSIATSDEELLSPHNPFIKVGMYYGFFAMIFLIISFIYSQPFLIVCYLIHSISGILPFFPLIYFKFRKIN
jgi:hypothetical protein